MGATRVSSRRLRSSTPSGGRSRMGAARWSSTESLSPFRPYLRAGSPWLPPPQPSSFSLSPPSPRRRPPGIFLPSPSTPWLWPSEQRRQGSQTSGAAFGDTTPLGRFARLTPGRAPDRLRMKGFITPHCTVGYRLPPLPLFSPILISLGRHPWTFICTPGSHVGQRLRAVRRHKACRLYSDVFST